MEAGRLDRFEGNPMSEEAVEAFFKAFPHLKWALVDKGTGKILKVSLPGSPLAPPEREPKPEGPESPLVLVRRPLRGDQLNRMIDG